MAERPEAAPAPGLWRRMACLLYEGLVLFGLSLVPAAIGTAVMAGAGPAAQGHRYGLLVALCFLTYALYFTWFWSRHGQTLPMKTWRIRVETAAGGRLSMTQALLRFALACAWFAPAWLLSRVNGWHGIDALAAQVVGVLAYALLALLHPQRQFWHDALARTQLVAVPKA